MIEKQSCWNTVALDSGRRYRFVYLCDDDDWNSDSGADDYVVDSHDRVHGVVDTSMGWVLPIVGGVTVETLIDLTWSMSGVRL